MTSLSINEPIAKAANRESGATGAFWQVDNRSLRDRHSAHPCASSKAVLAFKDRPSFAVGTRKEMKNLAETVRDTARCWFSGFQTLGKLYE